MIPVGMVTLALLSLPGAAMTNHLLRDRVDAARIVLAVAAGVGAGAVVSAAAYAVLVNTAGTFGEMARFALARDGWFYGAVIAFGGPLATAAAVWKWRPRARLAGDLRA